MTDRPVRGLLLRDIPRSGQRVEDARDRYDLDLPITMSAMVCANGETIEYILKVKNTQVAGPIWTSGGPAAALRTLITGLLRG